MPMKPGDSEQLTAFLGTLLSGAAEFGIKALPLIKAYERAKHENLDFWELVLTDEGTSQQLISAMQKHVEKLSPRVIAALKLVINAKQESDLRKKHEAENLSKARTAQPVHARSLDDDV